VLVVPRARESSVEGFYVGGTVEDGDEQARLVVGGSVKHGLPRREMAERSWTDNLVVDRKPAFENYDCLGSGMSMRPYLETSWVADEVVLRPESGSLYRSRTPISRS
jgi:hypothetical protein